MLLSECSKDVQLSLIVFACLKVFVTSNVFWTQGKNELKQRYFYKHIGSKIYILLPIS